MRFYTETTIIGKCFEDYVKSLFNPQYFIILHCSDNSDPDLTIEYAPRHELFNVECKFRARLLQGNIIKWSKRDNITHYEYQSKINNIPTFVIIGLGNKPCDPERVFCIPLERASKQTILPLSLLEQYEHLPRDGNFFWKYNILK